MVKTSRVYGRFRFLEIAAVRHLGFVIRLFGPSTKCILLVRWPYETGTARHGDIALPTDRQSVGGVADGSVLHKPASERDHMIDAQLNRAQLPEGGYVHGRSLSGAEA